MCADLIDVISSKQLKLGAWKALLFCLPATEGLIQQFYRSFPIFLTSSTTSNDGGIHFILVDGRALSELDLAAFFKSQEEKVIWRNFHEDLISAYSAFGQARTKEDPKFVGLESFFFSWPLYWYLSHRSSIVKSETTKIFFALVVDQPDVQAYVSFLISLIFLSARWHIGRGGLCLHSSAIARSGSSGFLFLGNSGAGKSTAAYFGMGLGYLALGDDLNFVMNNGVGRYILSACLSPKVSEVGYSSLQPKLRAIFKLVKDSDDKIEPLSKAETVRALLDGLNQVPKAHLLEDELFKVAFHTICDIARRIPAFELHFRKSPDFWKLIDEQFPD